MMNAVNYRAFFGFKREPFAQNLKPDEILITPQVKEACARLDFALKIKCITLLTGDIGSGKSTTIRYALSRLHPSEYHVIALVAARSTFSEILRQIGRSLNFASMPNSTALLRERVQEGLMEIYNKKMNPVLVIDEASLLTADVFNQLHTLAHFEFDSLPVLPIVLAGQKTIIGSLKQPQSRSFASRVVGITNLKALDLEGMQEYVTHHLSIAGLKNRIFAPEAVVAIHQKSGGMLRKANNIAKGALVAATMKKAQLVTPEHVRISSSEIFE